MNHVRCGVCVALLLLLALSELYSAVAVTFDYPKAASWEHALRGPLFALPCALVSGLVLLIWTSSKETGFYVAASSLILYAGFICADAYYAPMERGDRIAMTIWFIFCATGIVAARLLVSRPMSWKVGSEPSR
jgi:hypothetical protein